MLCTGHKKSQVNSPGFFYSTKLKIRLPFVSALVGIVHVIAAQVTAARAGAASFDVASTAAAAAASALRQLTDHLVCLVFDVCFVVAAHR